MYQVQKKDDRLEDFNREKLIGGLLKSGATAEQAEELAVKIEQWLPSIVDNNIVKVADLRIKVIELLNQVNPTASANFQSYQKVK